MKASTTRGRVQRLAKAHGLEITVTRYHGMEIEVAAPDGRHFQSELHAVFAACQKEEVAWEPGSGVADRAWKRAYERLLEELPLVACDERKRGCVDWGFEGQPERSVNLEQKGGAR